MQEEHELGTLDERFVNMMIQLHNIMNSASDDDHSETSQRLNRLLIKYNLFDQPRQIAAHIMRHRTDWC